MAYVKGHGLRGNVQRAIDYIVNEAKTRNGSLVSWSSMSGASPSTMGIQWDIRKAIVEQKDYRKKVISSDTILNSRSHLEKLMKLLLIE